MRRMADERSVRMLSEETGAPEWVCRLALEADGEVEPPEDALTRDLLRADISVVRPAPAR
jgi:hypothetical protein